MQQFYCRVQVGPQEKESGTGKRWESVHRCAQFRAMSVSFTALVGGDSIWKKLTRNATGQDLRRSRERLPTPSLVEDPGSCPPKINRGSRTDTGFQRRNQAGLPCVISGNPLKNSKSELGELKAEV